jgi:hypothetical protein
MVAEDMDLVEARNGLRESGVDNLIVFIVFRQSFSQSIAP